MEPISIEKVERSSYSSFKAVRFEHAYFTAPMHIHPEYELILFEEGNGHAFVGDRVYQLWPGDFLLIGSNLPHLWLSADKYYDPDTKLLSASVYAQFTKNIFPPQEWNLEEFHSIWRLLEESQSGLAFSGPNIPFIQYRFRSLPSLVGMERLTMLYRILLELSGCPRRYLASPDYVQQPIYEDDLIVQRANYFMNTHYQENITLEDIADYAGMNPSALCRYYKKRTGKRLFEYITEMRISYATKLLAYRHKQITEVAYDCGYNNVSNFNRQFKRIVGQTPREYSNFLNRIPSKQRL